MKNLITVILLSCSVCHAVPAPPVGYYTVAEGKTGAGLRAALHGIIHSHVVIPYSSSSRLDTSDALKVWTKTPPTPITSWASTRGHPNPEQASA